jgi:hypothetical protein
VDINDNKIITGWDYKDLDSQSIKEYCKSDLIDMGVNLKDVKVYGKNKLKQMNIDPSTYDNWKNLSEDAFLNEKLKGNQTKLDKNKDGEISSDDFKMLRKEKSLSEDDSEDLYESKKQILNSDKLMDKEINEMLKTRKGREKLKNAVKKLDEEKLKK